MKAGIDSLCYASESKLYILKDNDLLEIALQSRDVNILAKGLPQDGLITSEDQKMIAWGDGRKMYDTATISVKNLLTGMFSEIKADAGERVIPITFFGTDLVYGIAKRSDITLDENGHTLLPMYKVSIRNEAGRVLKEYCQEGVYITDIEQKGEMISLSRQVRDENGLLVPTTEDQILNNNSRVTEKNYIESVVTENFETIRQLVLRSEADLNTLKLMEPKLVMFEGDRKVIQEGDGTNEGYDLFAGGSLIKRYTFCYDAVEPAWQMGGSVRDECGRLIYMRTTLPVKNQIMAISGSVTEAGGEPEDLRNACIETWFAYEGAEYKGVLEMPGRKILDLSGVSLEAVLYYVANEEPVLAELSDGSAMLIVGYNDYNVVVMNPARSEQVYKIGRGDATKMFLQGGNRFMSSVAVGD